MSKYEIEIDGFIYASYWVDLESEYPESERRFDAATGYNRYKMRPGFNEETWILTQQLMNLHRHVDDSDGVIICSCGLKMPPDSKPQEVEGHRFGGELTNVIATFGKGHVSWVNSYCLVCKKNWRTTAESCGIYGVPIIAPEYLDEHLHTCAALADRKWKLEQELQLLIRSQSEPASPSAQAQRLKEISNLEARLRALTPKPLEFEGGAE